MSSLGGLPKLLENRLRSLIELLPAGRDIYLTLAGQRIGVTYRGLFESCQAARAAVPAQRANHYDVINKGKAERAAEVKERLEAALQVEDYALLFWLRHLLDERSTLLELGGNIGQFFYRIQRFGICGPGLRWTIAELPEAVALGTTIAQERGEQRLTFIDSSRLSAAEPFDLFMTAGALQYMEAPLWTLLSGLAQMPRHVLVHNLPVHPTRSYWTLQRLSLCEVPYRIYAQTELDDQMASLGYRQVDAWQKARPIEIPFHREMQIQGYLGYYFSRQP